MARPICARMGLQRQRPSGGEHLEQEGELSADVGERSTVVECRRSVGVCAEPELGPGPAVGLDAEQLRDRIEVAPGVVLHDTVDALHPRGSSS